MQSLTQVAENHLKDMVERISLGRLTFVAQGDKDRDCGQRCIAMITKLPVEIIYQYIDTTKGTHPREVLFTLYQLGVDCVHDETKCKHGVKLPDFCILRVHNKHYRHWNIHYKGWIIDSCTGVFTLNDAYKNKRFRVDSYSEIFA